MHHFNLIWLQRVAMFFFHVFSLYMSSQYRWAITSLENAQKSNNPVIKYMILKNQPLNFQCWASTSDLQVWGEMGENCQYCGNRDQNTNKIKLFCRVVKGCGPVPFKKCSTLIYSETSSNHGIISWLLPACVWQLYLTHTYTYRPLRTLWKPFLPASLNHRKQPMEQAKGLVGQKWSLPKSYFNNGLWPPGYSIYTDADQIKQWANFIRFFIFWQ